jgi:DHA1 family bicyclomycin/chloramphenicol resistance-like MFS transporter
MARIMSFIMTVFILVPVLAPALGQAILLLAGWRAIFGSFLILAVIIMVWLGVRQPETLQRNKRRPFTMQAVLAAFREVLKTRISMAYAMVAGCIMGAFFGYLNVCQQIFQVQYGLGVQFPLYFAILALAVGFAALLNSALVMRFGMHALAIRALLLMMVLSWLFVFLVWQGSGHPALWLFVAICFAVFFCLGVLFGNVNAIAMEPLGHVAGTAAAVIGSISTLVAVTLGYFIGSEYNGTLYPMSLGFACLSSVSVLLVFSVKRE